nr:putative glycosyltransferase family 4 protein [uncultured bacterium]
MIGLDRLLRWWHERRARPAAPKVDQSPQVAPLLMFVVNVDWFFVSHRLPIALAAQQQGYRVHVATGVTDRRAELEAHGLVVHALPVDRGASGPIGAWRMAVAIWRVFRFVQPDLVHLVTIKPVLFGGLAARLAGIRSVVAAVSGLGYVFVARGPWAVVRRTLISAWYRLVFSNSKVVVIFQNTDDREQLARATHLAPARCELIRGSGVDLDDYVVQSQAPGAPVAMLAARLLADKGVREFVQAATLLRRQGCVARFVLVGDVDPANPASLDQSELDAWSRDHVVECWGHCSDMPQILAQARLVVLPSYREGMPKILLEAAACGRAVVTTDVPGCRDAIEPGVTGLLVPPRDADALAQAIRALLDDELRCRAMGLAGRALAEQEFDVRHVVARHLELYGRCLARQSCAGST